MDKQKHYDFEQWFSYEKPRLIILSGANSFMATMERISDPYKSNMLAPDQISGIRVGISTRRGTRNAEPLQTSLFAKDLPDDVNFWGEPVMQLDPDQLKKYGQFGMSFNLHIQTGQYSDLDRELRGFQWVGLERLVFIIGHKVATSFE